MTGTIVTQALAAGRTTVNGGYYAATTLNAVDADLATGNVKSGVNIFGVAGSPSVVDTASGDAAAGDILSGKKAYVNGSLVTGNIETQTLSNTSTTVTAGVYAATSLNAVDTDLITGNVKSGVNLFGVAGSTNVVDTTSGDAVAGDILSGKKAYAGGSLVTGNIAVQALSNTSTTVSAGYYAGTTLNAVDADLITDNIKSGVTIFGVVGSSTVNSTSGVTAAAGDMLLNKTAYVNGVVVTGTIVTQTLAAGSTTVNGGYYAATTLNAVDADLATGNVKSGVNIFGVAGSPSVVDTASGDAAAGDILSGKRLM